MLFRQEPSGGKKFAVGAIVGGLVGSISALILAPKAGKKLREDISTTYNEMADKVEELLTELHQGKKKVVKKGKKVAARARKKRSGR